VNQGNPPLRLTPIQRLDLDEEYRDVAATAIELRHKHAIRLDQTKPESLDNRTLAVTVLRLKGWIAERTEAQQSA